MSFRSKWLEFPPQTPRYRGAKSDKRASGTFGTAIVERSQQNAEESTKDGHRQESVKGLLTRLCKGHHWLAETHLRLLEEREVYEGMEDRFLVDLDLWDGMDNMLRELHTFEGCVMGPGHHCPTDSPVRCQGGRARWRGDPIKESPCYQ